jgi:rubrerythrin
MRCPIATIEEFYAHALAIEREAAERYEEFEAWFNDRGADVLAGLCHNLAVLERSHLAALLDASRGLTLPAIPGDGYRWLEGGSPEAAARALFHRVASERHLMEIALHAEKKAQRFFEWVAEQAPSEPVRALARELAQEEAEHVRWVSSALEYSPAEPIDWDKVLARASPGAP